MQIGSSAPAQMTEILVTNEMREKRKELGLNQSEMAKMLGVTQGLISQIEKGTIGVSKKMKHKLEALKKA
jgi:predicted transcriptional regulator